MTEAAYRGASSDLLIQINVIEKMLKKTVSEAWMSPYCLGVKIIHKIKSSLLRRRLIRQRAENIRTLRDGRRAARAIKIELAREMRLCGFQECPAIIQKNACRSSEPSPSGRTAGGMPEGRISSILGKIHFSERREA